MRKSTLVKAIAALSLVLTAGLGIGVTATTAHNDGSELARGQKW